MEWYFVVDMSAYNITFALNQIIKIQCEMKKIILVFMIAFSISLIAMVAKSNYDKPSVPTGEGYHLKTCGCDGVSFIHWKPCCCPGYEESCTQGKCNGIMNYC